MAEGGGKEMRMVFRSVAVFKLFSFELRLAGAAENHSLLMQKSIKNCTESILRCLSVFEAYSGMSKEGELEVRGCKENGDVLT